MTGRRRTATSNFGVSRREAHDAAAFYARFEAPEILPDSQVPHPRPIPDPFVCGDARKMDEIEDGSVALVVTSPPYFAGKKYEEELDREGVPSSYLEYLDLLRQVFAECKRKLEPGGRIAVNVANLGRKPYRSLSADVIKILQDDLHMLLRGEVIWQKSEGASGSCAWGSFRSPANPVLRDLTERVVIASKGRFDRALTAKQREAQGLPFENSLSSDEFMAATLDVWGIPPESAKRVGHPAPFPVELPERLIRLYTYADDLVVDPFMGSGSTLLAAAKLGRRYAGYDLDPAYVEIARARVQAANSRREETESAPERAARSAVATPLADKGDDDGFQARATREGGAVQAIAERVLEEAGFTIVARNARVAGIGLILSVLALDADGLPWYVDVSGAFTTTRSGLFRTDTVWRCLGRAHVLARNGKGPIVLLTSHLPRRGSEGDIALRAAGTDAVFDAIEMLSDEGRSRLTSYAEGGRHEIPLAGFWTEAELDRRSD
ncbi:MAG: site-specific DNA-methyltransferase [Acidimicrobiales bacterium]|jgi:site-specific DNA-methyltransferase (adenine-specific)